MLVLCVYACGVVRGCCVGAVLVWGGGVGVGVVGAVVVVNVVVVKVVGVKVVGVKVVGVNVVGVKVVGVKVVVKVAVNVVVVCLCICGCCCLCVVVCWCTGVTVLSKKWHLQDHDRMLEVHISKHSSFRLKITVGCLTSTYRSIRLSAGAVSQDHGQWTDEDISKHSHE